MTSITMSGNDPTDLLKDRLTVQEALHKGGPLSFPQKTFNNGEMMGTITIVVKKDMLPEVSFSTLIAPATMQKVYSQLKRAFQIERRKVAQMIRMEERNREEEKEDA